jgi:hypothetical protein
MKKFTQLFALFCLALTAGFPLFAQYNKANLSLKSEDAETKFSFDKLRLYPITANRVFLEAHKSLGNYKPLKNGLADGSIKIVERGAGGELAQALGETPPPPSAADAYQVVVEVPVVDSNYRNYDGHVVTRARYQQLAERVEPVNPAPEPLQQVEEEPALVDIVQEELNFANDEMGYINGEEYDAGSASDEVNRLFIENTSNDTVFIMAGEVVKGGKQDRVIASDMIIPPHSKPIDLSVFCVEHGRWTYGGDADASDGFTGYANVSSNSVRKAAITTKDQSQVWEEVEEVTVANDAVSETGTLNALEEDADYQKELLAYEARFANLPNSGTSVIGVVAVTGDHVIGCDMFATPDLFRNAFPDLLKSYASEAITSGAKVSIGSIDVDKYISNILDESKQKERVLQKGQMLEQDGMKVHISTF